MWISKPHFDLIKDAAREFRVWHEAQRQDWAERLFEKEKRINELRTELAGLKIEADRMRLVLMPLGSPAGALYAQRFDHDRKPQAEVPEFDGPLDWASEMKKLVDQEEEDGSRSDRRDKVRSESSDGAS